VVHTKELENITVGGAVGEIQSDLEVVEKQQIQTML